MSYQVLARKWRPRSFAELVGQSHVLQALVNGLDQNRLHHAYLFTGTRGVGKTTIARIFAKCLNCQQGVSSKPCGECAACHEINEGRFVDLIEVDAASRTKVEDTRELLDNVQYAPTMGRYKVYLIDEVHMLSTHSFNALLKTLEEPPPHVKFLLATTDPQKLPVTILSRCLQFSLKNMTPERIVAHLETVLAAEDVAYEVAGLWQIAIVADGSMRDALSLTDQAIAFGNGRIVESEVSAMLGTIDRGQVMRMVQALVSADASAVIAAVSDLAEYSPDYLAVLNDMLSVLHRVAIAQAVPDAIDNSQGDADQVSELAAAMRAEDVQLYYQVGLIGKKDLPLAPDPRSGFEMAMLRMLAFRPDAAPIEKGGTGAQSRESANQADSAKSLDKLPEPDPDPDPDFNRPSTAFVENERKTQDNFPAATSVDMVKTEPATDSPPLVGEHIFQPSVNEPRENKLQTVEATNTDSLKVAEATNDASLGVIDDSVEQVQRNDESVVDDVSANHSTKVDAVDEVDEKIALDGLNSTSWIMVFRSLALGGVTGTIGSYCEYVRHDGSAISLRLDSQRSTMYDEIHRERIEAMLSNYFDRAVSLDVVIGTIETETPAGWRERKINERLEQARESIYADVNVQALINDFSATLLEQSIAPIGNIIR